MPVMQKYLNRNILSCSYFSAQLFDCNILHMVYLTRGSLCVHLSKPEFLTTTVPLVSNSSNHPLWDGVGIAAMLDSPWLLLHLRKQSLHLHSDTTPVSWCYRIHRLHLCRSVRPPPTSDMTLNHLMARLQSWSLGKCRVLLHCLYSKVHSDLEW